MATNPATAPEAAPRLVGLPTRIRSANAHDKSPAAAATWVFVTATAATLLAVKAEPPLNPNQPNHSSVAPIRTSGRLCGRSCGSGQPRRRPRHAATTNAAAPALAWTTAPPAKSNAPSLAAHPVGEKSQWATGA